MQVVGASVTDEAIRVIASRGTRPVVVEWAERVLKRHLRREKTLMVRIKDIKKLEAAMIADDLSGDVATRIRKGFAEGQAVYTPAKRAVEQFLQTAGDTMDWIESLPASDRRIKRIERMAWADAERLAEAWHEALARVRKISGSIMDGARKIIDLGDGSAFAAELTTANALRAEGQAMGHCVGGYWKRVEAGETRIVSIRDSLGMPHVTIELSAAPRICLEDGEDFDGDHKPANGIKDVRVAEKKWVAVQVRGKGNLVPVPKYLGLVGEWLDGASIPWVEFGTRREAFAPIGNLPHKTVYTVAGRHFIDLVNAASFGEELIRNAKLKSNESFAEKYKGSGLYEIHRHHPDPERLLGFLESQLEQLLENFGSLAASTGFEAAFRRSGLDLVMSNIPESGERALVVRSRIFEALVSWDLQHATFRSEPLVDLPHGKGIDLVVHDLPLLPLNLLARGMTKGLEQRVVELVGPQFERSIEKMQQVPDAVHIIRNHTGGLDGTGITQGFMFSGHAAEYARSIVACKACIVSKVREARLALKRLRLEGLTDIGTINLAANILADGYEERLEKHASSRVRGDGLAVLPEASKPVPRMAVANAQPVVKKYRMPGR